MDETTTSQAQARSGRAPQGMPVGAEELHERARETDAGDYAEQIAAADIDEIPGGGWREIFGPAITALKVSVVLAASVFLVVIFSQSAALVREILALPEYAAYPLLGLLGLIVLLAVGAALRLLWMYARRRASPSLEVSLDAQLAKRRGTRAAALAEPAAARNELVRFLREYPVTRTHQMRLRRLGIAPRDVQSMLATRAELIDAADGNDEAWISRLDKEFLAPLDRAAVIRARKLGLSVAVYTASSPRAVVDAIGVLGVSSKLLGDCCVLYNLRAGRLGTMRLLVHLIINLAAAGAMDEAGEAVGDSAADLMKEVTGATSATLSNAVGLVAGKAAEGGANALLLMRLGRAARRALRPVRVI